MYDTEEMSIKSSVRFSRQKIGIRPEVTIITSKTLVPQGKNFKCYLTNATKKVTLPKYLKNEVISVANNTLCEVQTMCVSYGRVVDVVKAANIFFESVSSITST